MDKTKKERLTIYLEPELMDFFKSEAESNMRSLSDHMAFIVTLRKAVHDARPKDKDNGQ